MSSNKRSLQSLESESKLEKARLAKEIKRLETEKRELTKNLEEEKEVRKRIETQSKSLVTGIKRSCGSEVETLKEQLRMKTELDEHKQEVIDELDVVVKQLHQEINRLSGELNNARYKEGEVQHRLTKSYRGSISKMESELSKKSTDLENHVKQIESKHVDQLAKTTQKYEIVIEEMRASLDNKSRVLIDIEGRLDEAHCARESALEELHSMRSKYQEAIRELEVRLKESQMDLNNFRKKDSVEVEDLRQQLMDREALLDQASAVNEDMFEKLQLVREKQDLSEAKLKEKIEQLQNSVRDLEKKNLELYAITQEHLQKQSELLPTSDIAVQKVLQEQLNKCQEGYDYTKEALVEERLRNKELKALVAERDIEVDKLKIDVRYYTREHRLEKQNCQKLTEDQTRILHEKQKLEECSGVSLQQISDLKNALCSVTANLDQSVSDLKQSKMLLDTAKKETNALDAVSQELKIEVAGLKKKVKECESLKSSLDERDAIISSKNQELDEKNRKMETLSMHVKIEQEALKVLDDQLKDFETAFIAKNAELEASELRRNALDLEYLNLKEQLKKSKIELNEAKSLKTFVEKRLADVEDSLKHQDSQFDQQITMLRNDGEILRQQNAKLQLEVSQITSELQSVQVENETLHASSEKIRVDNTKLNEEIMKMVKVVVEEKDQNRKLKSGLEEALNKAEAYKRRCEELCTDHGMLDLEKHTREVQMQSTIEQQTKLIDYLQTKINASAKKKDKKFHLFGKTKSQIETTPYATKAARTPATAAYSRYAATPSTPIRAPKNLSTPYSAFPPKLETPTSTTGSRYTSARISTGSNNSRTRTSKNRHRRILTSIPMTSSTPVRLVEEHEAVRSLEEKAANLKQQLAQLQDSREVKMIKDDVLVTPRKEDCVMLRQDEEPRAQAANLKQQLAQSPNSREVIIIKDDILATARKEDGVMFGQDEEPGTTSGIRKSLLLRDMENRLDMNCAYPISNELYIIGCEEGLYSRKVSNQLDSKVKIEGVGPVYQIEFASALNSVIMIEGDEKHLILVHMGMLRVCAEAAACSKPTLTVQPIGKVNNCHLIQYKEISKDQIILAVGTPKHLHILSWDGNDFISLKRLNTRETITSMLMTSNSIIFGCDRIYELDIQNFQLEEFLDDSDDSLHYLRFSCDMFANFPIAILDTGMSTWEPEKQYIQEFLICFPDVGVFVDAYGRRTRGDDIVWSKLPLSVAYRHPNLYIVYFSSVEIINLKPDSYTKTRIIESEDSIGYEQTNVPESRFLSLHSPRMLGNGNRTASVLVSSLEKHKAEIFEVDLEVGVSST